MLEWCVAESSFPCKSVYCPVYTYIQIGQLFLWSCCRPVSKVLASTGQRIGLWGSRLTRETTRSAHKVGFIREKGKAAPRNGQGAQKIGSSLLFTLGFLKFGHFCWGGESGVEWSVNISLQGHMHSPAKAFWLSASWQFCGISKGLWLLKVHVPLQDLGLSWGMGHWLILSSDPPDPISPSSETSTELLLGRKGGISSGCPCWQWGRRGRVGAGELVSGVDPCVLQGTLIELDRGITHQQKWVFLN
jgi:hypothetical protein